MCVCVCVYVCVCVCVRRQEFEAAHFLSSQVIRQDSTGLLSPPEPAHTPLLASTTNVRDISASVLEAKTFYFCKILLSKNLE